MKKVTSKLKTKKAVPKCCNKAHEHAAIRERIVELEINLSTFSQKITTTQTKTMEAVTELAQNMTKQGKLLGDLVQLRRPI